MRVNIPSSFFAIAPLKILGAVTSTLLVLAVIAIGGGGEEVAIVMSLALAGNLSGVLLWSRVLSYSRKYVTGYIGGYVGIFITLILLYDKSITSIYVASFLLIFMMNLTYLSAMFLVAEEYSDKLGEMMSRLESVGGWAWVAGLGIGAAIVDLLDYITLITLLTLISFIGILLSIVLLAPSIIKRIIEGFKKDLGLLPLLDMSLQKIIEYEETIPETILSGIHVIFSGSIMNFPIYIRFRGISKERLLLYSAILTQFLAFGLVYSQLITYLKGLGYVDSFIYIFSMVGSVVSALMYPRAGRVTTISKYLISSNILRIVLFIMLIILEYTPPILKTAILILFAVIDGYTWAYIVIILNLIAIKHSKEEVGISNFIRNIGNLIGAFASGFIISLFNIELNFFIGIIVLSLSTILYIRTIR